jgi:hypothetical protein
MMSGVMGHSSSSGTPSSAVAPVPPSQHLHLEGSGIPNNPPSANVHTRGFHHAGSKSDK